MAAVNEISTNGGLKPQQESTVNKIPYFYGNFKDTVHPKYWIARVEQIALAQGWSSTVTLNAAAAALREHCEEWYHWELDCIKK